MFRRVVVPFFALLCLANCTGMDAALKMYGYIPLTPPSRLLRPGAMIFKKKGRRNGMGIVCTPEQSLGTHFPILESDTIPTYIEDSVGKEFDLDAETVAAITGGAGHKATKKISVTLNNAHLYEINDWIVATFIGERSPACSKAIKDRVAAGFVVTMITSSLMADAAYQVEWSDSDHAGSDAKMKTIGALGAKGNLLLEHAHQNKFEADNLVWGIRTDDFLAGVTMPEE